MKLKCEAKIGKELQILLAKVDQNFLQVGLGWWHYYYNRHILCFRKTINLLWIQNFETYQARKLKKKKIRKVFLL